MKMKPTTVLLIAVFTSAFSARGAITIDGSYSDWTDIPSTYEDLQDSTSIDIRTVKVTHDSSYVYFYVSYWTTVNPNAGPSIYLSVDSDNNTGTGYDIYGLGLVGSEASWVNDFPFEQSTGNYNTGAGLSNANAAIAPYYTVTTEQEYRISRAATRNTDDALVFPENGTIRFLFWTDDGVSPDTMGQAGIYTIPEPGAALLGSLGMIALLRRRR